MKKYIISTSVAFTLVSIVFAQGAEQEVHMEPGMMGRVQVTGAGSAQGGSVNVMYAKPGTPTTATARAAMPAVMMGAAMPTITTGDATVDAKIKALQDERYAKIKALNAEYDAKLKAIIGDKTITIGRGGGVNGGTAPSAGKPSGRMMLDANESASGDAQGGPVMGGLRVRTEGDASLGEPAPAPGIIRGLLNRLFSRDN